MIYLLYLNKYLKLLKQKNQLNDLLFEPYSIKAIKYLMIIFILAVILYSI
jgi:hypothetical protein